MLNRARRKFYALSYYCGEGIKSAVARTQKHLFPDQFGLFPGLARYRWMQAEKKINWKAMPSALLLNSFSTANWGGNDLFVADTNGDGKPEFLWLQSPGIFKTELYRQRAAFSHLKNENPDLFCLTATDTNGRVLWQVGSPREDWLYCSHSAERMVCCYDIDGDGVTEVLALSSQQELIVLDGRTGHIKARTILPADNFAIMACGRFGPGPADVRILVSNSTAGYPPHEYGNPTLFLDPDLNIVHTGDYLGSGHCPLVFDADGDGYDEVLLGYELVDLCGNRKWIVDRWRTETFSSELHVDEARLIRQGDGWRIAIAGSDRLYVIDEQGNTVGSLTQPHVQYVVAGKFDPANPETCLFITNSLNDHDSVSFFSMSGQSLSEVSLPEHWPMGRPRCIERLPYFHKGVPVVAWKSNKPGAPDLVIYCEKGWPYGVNAQGKPALVFPQTPLVPKPERVIPPHRPDDYGYSYDVRVADIDADGADEVIVYDRTHVWMYEIS